MDEILFMWAKEHPDYKYQQGMNEILAVIVICLANELVNKHQEEQPEAEDDSSDEDNLHVIESSLFKDLHDSKFVWADAYTMFERIMDLGIKELYYKDVQTPDEQVEELLVSPI